MGHRTELHILWKQPTIITSKSGYEKAAGYFHQEEFFETFDSDSQKGTV